MPLSFKKTKKGLARILSLVLILKNSEPKTHNHLDVVLGSSSCNPSINILWKKIVITLLVMYKIFFKRNHIEDFGRGVSNQQVWFIFSCFLIFETPKT